MPPISSDSNPQNRRPLSQRVGLFLAALSIMSVVWLVIFPALANQPDMKAYIEENERSGIDPSVRFYSELPCMAAMIQKVDEINRLHGREFWQRPQRPSTDAKSPEVTN